MENQARGTTPQSWLPPWMSEKCIFITSSVCFGLLILLSFFIFAPVAATVDDFEGNCYLFASKEKFGDDSLCSYCIAVPVIFLLICGIRFVLLIIKVTNCRGAMPEKILFGVSVCGVHFVIYILDVLLVVLILVTASLLSAGLSSVCDDIYGGRSMCSKASQVRFGKDKVSSHFYPAVAFAEGSAWFTFCFWTLVVCFETLMLWKSGAFSWMPCGSRRTLVPTSETA